MWYFRFSWQWRSCCSFRLWCYPDSESFVDWRPTVLICLDNKLQVQWRWCQQRIWIWHQSSIFTWQWESFRWWEPREYSICFSYWTIRGSEGSSFFLEIIRPALSNFRFWKCPPWTLSLGYEFHLTSSPHSLSDRPFHS